MQKTSPTTCLLAAFALALALTLPTASSALPLKLGETAVELPNPDGLVLVTPAMRQVHSYMQLFVPTRNMLLGSYIPKASEAEALAGKYPDTVRYALAQTMVKFVSKTFTTSDFAGMSDAIKASNATALRRDKTRVPDIERKLERIAADRHDVRKDLADGQTLTLPIHRDTPDELAFSLVMRNSMTSPTTGQTVDVVQTGTMTNMLVKGHVLFLYVFGGEHDIGYTRKASADWADAIRAANDGGNGPKP